MTRNQLIPRWVFLEVLRVLVKHGPRVHVLKACTEFETRARKAPAAPARHQLHLLYWRRVAGGGFIWCWARSCSTAASTPAAPPVGAAMPVLGAAAVSSPPQMIIRYDQFPPMHGHHSSHYHGKVRG